MATLASLSASVELLPLLRGSVVIRRVEIDGLSLVLERNAQRQANWLLGAEHPIAASAQAAPPSDRGDMPVIHDVRIVRSQVVYRTSTGNEFRAQLDNATLSAADPDQPVRLDASGSYNDVPLTIAAMLGSLNALRDGTAPFPLDLHVASGENTLDFRGTATDPLNLDGVEGEITLVAPRPDTVLDVVDAKTALGGPINFAAHVTRKGDVWRLDQAAGSLDGKPFNLPFLQFTEGQGGRPGAVTGELDFPSLSGVVAGRQVSLGSLHISLNQSLRVELRDARLGNMPDGSDPAMATLASLSAEIDAPSLMNGSFVVRRADVDGLSLLLERSAQYGDNWNFATGRSPSPAPAVPRRPDARPASTADRGSMPVIHDLRIAHSQVVFRESAGHEHRVRLDNVTLAAADQLVRLDANGSYNDLPLIVAAKLGSYSALRDAGAPFPLDLHVASGENTLDFRGAVTDLLARGRHRRADRTGRAGARRLAGPHGHRGSAEPPGPVRGPAHPPGRQLAPRSGERCAGRQSLQPDTAAIRRRRADRPNALTGELEVPRLATTVLGRNCLARKPAGLAGQEPAR